MVILFDLGFGLGLAVDVIAIPVIILIVAPAYVIKEIKKKKEVEAAANQRLKNILAN